MSAAGYHLRAWLAPLLLLLLLASASGCGAGLSPAFDARFPEDDRARLDHVRARLSQAGSATRRAVTAGSVLAATTDGAEPELLALDLESARVRWRKPFRSSARPEVFGDLVCGVDGAHLLAFDAASGTERFRLRLDDCAYVGGARDGDRLLIACREPSRPGEQARAQVLALDARSGGVLWRRDSQGELGRPAATADLVFVPWRRQSLAVLDARSGVELVRVRARDDVIDWVFIAGDDVIFGGARAHHLGAPDTGATLIETRRLPGTPALWPNAFEAEPGTRSARGRVALHFEPELASDGLRVSRDRFYALFYRYVFAYDAAGTLRWARMLSDDVIAASAVPSGLAVVTETGRVLLLPGAGGEPQVRAELQVQLASARVSAADLKAANTGSAAPALRRSLTEIALDPDNRLVPARGYALARLAELQAPEVTRDLLDVYAQSATPPDLKRVVADALRTRRTGLPYLVDALLARYDFIEQTRPAPLSVIVPALVEARESRAVPNLVARMFDHETPLSVLPAVVAAVAALGGDDAVEPLLSFLRLYRADSSFAEQPEALIEAARGVLAHGGESAVAQLADLTQDGRASAGLTAGITALLAPATPDRAGEQPVVARAEPVSALPERLTDEAVSATFAAHVDDLRACIIGELGRNPELAQVRLAFIAENDGSTHAWSFAPNTPELVDCLYQKTAEYRFPRFQKGREVVKYVIAVRAREFAPATPVDATAEPWWQWYAQRPRANADAAHGDPWWRSRQPLAPLSLGRAAPESPSRPQNAPAAASRPAAAPARAATPPTARPQPAAPASQPAAEADDADDAWWVPVPETR